MAEATAAAGKQHVAAARPSSAEGVGPSSAEGVEISAAPRGLDGGLPPLSGSDVASRSLMAPEGGNPVAVFPVPNFIDTIFALRRDVEALKLAAAETATWRLGMETGVLATAVRVQAVEAGAQEAEARAQVAEAGALATAARVQATEARAVRHGELLSILLAAHAPLAVRQILDAARRCALEHLGLGKRHDWNDALGRIPSPGLLGASLAALQLTKLGENSRQRAGNDGHAPGAMLNIALACEPDPQVWEGGYVIRLGQRLTR